MPRTRSRPVMEAMESRLFLSTTQVSPITALYETPAMPTSGDSADDTAIWVNAANPSQSAIIGTNKQGGLYVYSPTGTLLNSLTGNAYNNIDLRTGFSLGGQSVVLISATNVTANTLNFFTLNTSTRTLTAVGSVKPTIVTSSSLIYGVAMYRNSAGEDYVFVSNHTGGIQQFRLNGAGSTVAATLVRTITLSSMVEGLVADDENGALYVSQEDVALWKFGAEASAGSTKVAIDTVGGTGRLTADIEGLALYKTATGGYLIASIQGADDYAVYDRNTSEFVTRFKITAGATIDGTTDTDGIEVTSASLGGSLSEGAFIAQDDVNTGGNQNFKIVSWGDIARAQGVPLVIANPVNQAPKVNAGADAAITLPTNSVNLAGTASDDGGPGALSVNWTVVASPTGSSVTFGNSASASTSASFSAAGTYRLRLTATDTALSAFDEVQIVVNPAPVNTGLVVEFKFSEGAGLSTADSSGNGFGGTLINSPTWTTGRSGGGLRFSNSAKSRVSVADRSALDFTKNLTLSTWVRPEAKTSQTLINKGTGVIDGYELSLSSNGTVYFRLNNRTSGDLYRLNSVSKYPTDGKTWMHIAATYDGTAMKLYINGKLESTKAATITIGTNSLALGIGGTAADGSRSLTGTMDNTRLFGRALSASEILALLQ